MNGNWPFPKGGVIDTKNCVAVQSPRLSRTNVPASKDPAVISSNPTMQPAPDANGYILTWRILDESAGAVVGYVEVDESSAKLRSSRVPVEPHYHAVAALPGYITEALAMLASRKNSPLLVAEPNGERVVYVGVDRMNVGIPSLPRIEVTIILARPNGKQSYIKVRVEQGKGYTVEAVNGELNTNYKMTADKIMHLTAEQTPYYVKEALLLLSY